MGFFVSSISILLGALVLFITYQLLTREIDDESAAVISITLGLVVATITGLFFYIFTSGDYIRADSVEKCQAVEVKQPVSAVEDLPVAKKLVEKSE